MKIIDEFIYPIETDEDGALPIEFDVNGEKCVIRILPKDVDRMQRIIKMNERIKSEQKGK